MQIRDRIHALIDGLPEGELPAVERFLAARGTAEAPFLRALADAPEDDEPLTAEDVAAIEEGYQDLAAGNVSSQSEVRRSLGL